MSLAIPRYQPDIPLGALLFDLACAVVHSESRGKATEEFERLFAESCGSKHALALSSVRFGLYNTIKFHNFPVGSEILCSSITIYPVIECLILSGLKPVFVDIIHESFSMDIADAKRKVTAGTCAILVTHLWGLPNNIDVISNFAERHKLLLLEDASQCMNGMVNERTVGTFGRAGFFSMGMTKTVNAYGGAVMVTDDDALVKIMRDKIESLRLMPRMALAKMILAEIMMNLATRRLPFTFVVAPLMLMAARLGKKDRLDHSSLQTTARLEEFPRRLETAFADAQARAAIRTMKNIHHKDAERRQIADWYLDDLSRLPALRLPLAPAISKGNYWMFVVFTERPDKLKEFLLTKKVDTALTSLDPCHEMPYFEEFNAELPTASALVRDALYLPCYHSLTKKDADRIVAAVKDYFESGMNSV